MPTDTKTCDPKLATLAANGGPTKTHPLIEGSWAIVTGPKIIFDSIPTDQRGIGYPRKAGVASDIGADNLEPSDRIFVDSFDASSKFISSALIGGPTDLRSVRRAPLLFVFTGCGGW